MGKPGRDRGHAPDDDAQGHEALSSACPRAVGQVAENWARREVTDKEDSGERTPHEIREMEVFLNLREHRGKHEAVEIIEEVQRGEQRQNDGGATDHGSDHNSLQLGLVDMAPLDTCSPAPVAVRAPAMITKDEAPEVAVPKRRATAESMATRQREISVSEF